MIETLPKGCYVALHIGTGPSRIEEAGGVRMIVTDQNKRFELSDDLWIERLDEQLAKHIQSACEPPHYNIESFAYDRHLYSFIRRIPDVGMSDHEGIAEVYAAITLSRLVHPTSIGDRYCAKVFHFGLPDSAIQALVLKGRSNDVFLPNNWRNWLSVEDREDLRKLMVWVPRSKPMHARVHRAYWNHERAR